MGDGGGVWFISIHHCWQGGSEPGLADPPGLSHSLYSSLGKKVFEILDLFCVFIDLPNEGDAVRRK